MTKLKPQSILSFTIVVLICFLLFPGSKILALTFPEAFNLAKSNSKGQLSQLETEIARLSQAPTSFIGKLLATTEINLKADTSGSKDSTNLSLSALSQADNLTLASITYNPLTSGISFALSVQLYPLKTNASLAKQKLSPDELEIKIHTARLFFAVFIGRLEVPLIEKDCQLKEEHLSLQKEKFSLGLISFAEVKNAAKNSSTLQTELKLAREKLVKDENALKKLLGLSNLNDLDLQLEQNWPHIEQLEINPELIAALDLHLLQAQSELSQLEKQKKPQVFASLNLNHLPKNQNFLTQISFSHNLYKPQHTKQIALAKLEVTKQEILLNEKKEAFYEEVKEALNSYKKAQETWQNAASSLAETTELLDLANTGASLGIISEGEIQEIALEYEWAKVKVSKTALDCLLSYFNLQKYSASLPELSL